MRGAAVTIALGVVLLGSAVRAQVPHPAETPDATAPTAGAIGHPGRTVEGPRPPGVAGPLDEARRLVSTGHPADALTRLHGLPPRERARPPVTAVRAIATFATLDPPLEPGSARTLTAARQAQLAAVVADLTPWVAGNPWDALAALTLGRAALVRGDLQVSADALARATGAHAGDPVAWNDRAMVLVALHRLPDAESCLEVATQLAPRDPEPWDNLGAVRLARGESDRAAEAFRRAIDAAPGEGRFQSDLASALLAAGDARGAVQMYRQAAARDPDSAVIAANLGYALALANQLDDSLTELRRAVTLNPTSVTAWNNLGLVQARRGDREAASEAFHRALTLDPADARAQANLGALESH